MPDLKPSEINSTSEFRRIIRWYEPWGSSSTDAMCCLSCMLLKLKFKYDQDDGEIFSIMKWHGDEKERERERVKTTRCEKIATLIKNTKSTTPAIAEKIIRITIIPILHIMAIVPIKIIIVFISIIYIHVDEQRYENKLCPAQLDARASRRKSWLETERDRNKHHSFSRSFKWRRRCLGGPVNGGKHE